MIRYLKYGIPGLVTGFILIWLMGDLVGRHNFFALILGSISGGNLALWIGQVAGRIKPPKAAKPTSLFPDAEQ